MQSVDYAELLYLSIWAHISLYMKMFLIPLLNPLILTALSIFPFFTFASTILSSEGIKILIKILYLFLASLDLMWTVDL